MSATATNPTPAEQAARLLMESVAIPQFAAKLAADYGIAPEDYNPADVRILSDRVTTACHRFLSKQAAGQQTQRQNGVKAAIDSSFAVAGEPTPSSQPTYDPVAMSRNYINLTGVKDAADAMLVARREAAKAAMGDCPTAMPTPTPPKMEEEEEEEKEKKKVAAAAAASAASAPAPTPEIPAAAAK